MMGDSRSLRPGVLFLAFGLWGIAFLARGWAAETDSTTLVGVAKLDITPSVPVQMYGYAARKTESEGIAGRLKAAALVIGGDSGDGPAVLLTVDCGAVPPSLRDQVFSRIQAKTKVKQERFMLCNSHTHAGPNLAGMASFTGTERQHLESYAQELTDKLERVVLSALEARRPSRLDWTSGSVGFAANRRVLKDGKWTGFGAMLGAPVDHSLPLLRVSDTQGKLLAVVVNYACHNTTLRGNFKQIHGDWAGAAQEAIESDHSGVTALVTIGCGADADPHPHGSVELCQQHGRALADEVKRLLSGPFKPITPRLAARSAVLQLPYAPLPPVDELKRRAANSFPIQRLLGQLERGEKLPTARDYYITVWTFGDDLAMIFLSDEVVVDYALRMKREFDGSRLWISAYANLVSGYVVSERLIGEGGYEVNNSLSALISYGRPESVQPSVEQRIIDCVRALLPEEFHKASREDGAAKR